MNTAMYMLMILTGEIHRIPPKPTSASPSVGYFHSLRLNKDQAVNPRQFRGILHLVDIA